MNRRTLYLVAVMVVAIHLGLYYLLNHLGSKTAPTRHPPGPPGGKPNFGLSQQTYDDPQGGGKIHYQEIRVSTQMADSDMVDRILRERAAKAAPTATPAATPLPPASTP